MACKIQELRWNIWETICRQVEADWDKPIIETYYADIADDYARIYKEAYVQFYKQEIHAGLFEFAGANCQEFVKLLVCMVIGSDRDFRNFKVPLYTFMERQFESIVAITGLDCCVGSSMCKGDGGCLH